MITNITMIICSFAIIDLRLGFEFRVVREFENFHYGWYLSLSITEGKKNCLKNEAGIHFYTEEFENIFLTSEEMDEIRNQINYLLETEDETNEPDIEKNGVDFFDNDNNDSP